MVYDLLGELQDTALWVRDGCCYEGTQLLLHLSKDGYPRQTDTSYFLSRTLGVECEKQEDRMGQRF